MICWDYYGSEVSLNSVLSMECSHLEENAMITAANIHLEAASRRCSVCSTTKSLWTCLTCGLVSCGRYINGHAKAHYEERQPLHCLCLDCDNLSVYCYKCDEFVVNDTLSGVIDSIRQHILHSSTLTLNGTTHNHAKENRQLRRQSSSESDDSEKKRLKTVCWLNVIKLPCRVKRSVVLVSMLAFLLLHYSCRVLALYVSSDFGIDQYS